MELVKLKKPIKKVKKRFTEEGLKRRIASSRTQMILNNPMKNQATRLKVSMQKKGTITSPRTLFKKGNKLKRFKGKKHTAISKMKKSIKMTGRKLHSDEHKEKLREKWKQNNPMKNPEIVKKNVASRKSNRKITANKKRRIASLTNPNVRKTWFKKKENKK